MNVNLLERAAQQRKCSHGRSDVFCPNAVVVFRNPKAYSNKTCGAENRSAALWLALTAHTSFAIKAILAVIRLWADLTFFGPFLRPRQKRT